jgi:predicted small integral membrane protein
MIKKAKAILIMTVSLWGLIGAIQNIIDWNGTIGAVGAVTSMSTIQGGSESWQATDSTLVILSGVVFIIAAKLASGGLCALGAIRMWQAQASDTLAYKKGKAMALTGCAIAIIMLFGGFIVIAESWFELWRSQTMLAPVLQSAFRYAGMIALIAIFVSFNDEL